MPFSRPTLTQLADRITSDFQTRITGANALARRSTLKVMAKAYAGACHLLYGYLDYKARQLFAFTADEEGLTSIGGEYGVNRKDATKAAGSITVTGTTGTAIPLGTELISGTDIVYTTDAAATLALGTASIAVTAVTGDADSNEDAGATLTFVSPITNVDNTATVGTAGLIGGADVEDVEDWRARILARKRKPPHGGIASDYENWAKEVGGVTRAWAIPLWQGVGTVGVAFARDDDTGSIFPSEAERTEVYDYLLSHTDPASGETVGVPVTVTPGLFMVELSPSTINLTIKISPNTAAVQLAAEAAITTVIKTDGGPQRVVYLSRLSEAVSNVLNEDRNKITAPADDITTASNEMHVLGTITWQDY